MFKTTGFFNKYVLVLIIKFKKGRDVRVEQKNKTLWF